MISAGRRALLFSVTLLAAGAPWQAQARTVTAGDSVETLRAACQEALDAEQRGVATTPSRVPCHLASRQGGSPEDLRNEVASLMAPTTTPSVDDLVVSALLVDAAVRKAADQPWGYLARCDIARRLHSADTLAACLGDLKRIAPNHPATLRALRSGAAPTPLGLTLARWLLLAALLATAAHAARRAWLRRRRPTGATLAGALVMAAALTSVFSRAAQAAPADGKDHLSEFTIDDADPEAGVPTPEQQNKQPLEFGYYLQDLAAKAQRAANGSDHALEARYDRALMKAAPQSAVGPRLLCNALDAGHDLPNAVVACRTALLRNGTNAGDYLHFVRLVLVEPGPLPAGEEQELNAVLDHLVGEAQLGALPTMLRCEVALRFKNVGRLQACTTELGRTAPNDPKTLSFEWALALEKNDHAAAALAVERARSSGMNAASVAKMEAETRGMVRRRLLWTAVGVVAVGMIAAAFWLVLRRWSSPRRHVPA